MSTSHTSLTSAADERKARLAKLASLKRKQPGSDTTVSQQPQPQATPDFQPLQDETPQPEPQSKHLSGRNYDPTTRAPRLGFDNSSTLLSTNPTLESQSTTLLQTTLQTAAEQEAELRAKEASGTGGVDLFKLQPKKPNWDLKRELEERKRKWNVEGKTREAVARMVRERIETKKREALEQREQELRSGGKPVDVDVEEAEEVGIEGAELVEGVHQRERKEEEEERREREMDAELEGEGVP